ncbi:hypothetical protein HMPREF1418_01084 [Helicobacter pylori GAM260BSi]|uniref:Uncharacterized protein n=1 Tax=Helicobacter pylori GAM260BSi TaxID=1159046 RepID=M3QSY2_HELPX|nr:hypothetical protein HMPREF1418_01084 [Helicobacter pylori GAM260BSi]
MSISDKIKTLKSVFCNQNVKELGVNQAAISKLQNKVTKTPFLKNQNKLKTCVGFYFTL